MAKNLNTFPVTKNGKFIGYADADQIAANPSLAIYDERKAEAAEAERQVEAAKQDHEKKQRSLDTAKQAGADPAQVKKGAASQ